MTSPIASAQTVASRANTAEATFPADIQRVLDLPENRIDTGWAALTFAREIYPEIEVVAYSARIDALAAEARQFIARQGRRDPDSVVRALNTWYYRSYGVQYDHAPNGRATRSNYFINGLLDTKRGQCITLPMLYMAIAQRLGYPVYAVMAPEHTFVRFVDPSLREQNIDLSQGAGYSSDAEYAFDLNISPEAIASGAYLRTLTRRQYLGVLLQQNAIVFSEQGNLDRAIRYFEKAYEIDPLNVYFSRNLALHWQRKAQLAETPELQQSHFQTALRYWEISRRLGWTEDPDANTRRASR
jgi:regulator of sirC expression with transglutaminase-like and TPR domain